MVLEFYFSLLKLQLGWSIPKTTVQQISPPVKLLHTNDMTIKSLFFGNYLKDWIKNPLLGRRWEMSSSCVGMCLDKNFKWSLIFVTF